MGRHKGFTLLELMIVVVVVGILAAIAYPTYRDQVVKSRRSEAYSALLSCAAAQERWYTATGSYATQAIVTANTLCGSTSTSGYYTLTVANNNCQFTVNGANRFSCYTLTAQTTTKSQQQEDTDCDTLTIDETGNRLSYNSSGGATTDCWRD